MQTAIFLIAFVCAFSAGFAAFSWARRLGDTLTAGPSEDGFTTSLKQNASRMERMSQ